MFLGLANFYQRFIKRFSNITVLITKLLKKDNMQNFQWTPDAQGAFNHLRTAFTTAPILTVRPGPANNLGSRHLRLCTRSRGLPEGTGRQDSSDRIPQPEVQPSRNELRDLRQRNACNSGKTIHGMKLEPAQVNNLDPVKKNFSLNARLACARDTILPI